MGVCRGQPPGPHSQYARTRLFIDRIPVTKDNVAANQAGEKGIRLARLAAIELALDQEQRLVQRDEAGQVQGVLLGGVDNLPGTRLPAAEGGGESTHLSRVSSLTPRARIKWT